MTGNVRITDSTLRDGSHAMRHQFTEGQVRAVVSALDGAGVEVIEVSHGDGLGGSSFNYGFSGTDEIALIRAAVDEAATARIAVLLLPGVGTVEDLRRAHDAGASVARIATHCTEADVSVEHFGAARELGMETVGFLMLAHRLEPAALARQARIMVDAGAQCVYVVDSWRRSSRGCRGWTVRRSSRATPACIHRSCCTRSAPRSATACPRTRSCSGSARPATWAGRKT